MDHLLLGNFLRESNAIEGIHRPLHYGEVERLETFIAERPTVGSVSAFVKTTAGADLREHPGMNVRVGLHRPPPGGLHVRDALLELLAEAPDLSPFELYCRYETLHPFMDGNGRSGRALWLWRMQSDPDWPVSAALYRGFLATFHYQVLDAHDSRKVS